MNARRRNRDYLQLLLRQLLDERRTPLREGNKLGEGNLNPEPAYLACTWALEKYKKERTKGEEV